MGVQFVRVTVQIERTFERGVAREKNYNRRQIPDKPGIVPS